MEALGFSDTLVTTHNNKLLHIQKYSSYHIFIGHALVLSSHLQNLFFLSTCQLCKMEKFFPRRDELLCLATLLLYIRRRQCDVTPAYTCFLEETL